MAFIYIQKALNLALRDILTYKNPDTSKKARKFALRFWLYKKPDTFPYAIFHGILEIGGGGGAFLLTKNIICVKFAFPKMNVLCVTFFYTKSHKLCVLFLYPKNNFLCVTLYIYNLVYLFFSYLTMSVCTIRPIRSINKFELFTENWSYSYDK